MPQVRNDDVLSVDLLHDVTAFQIETALGASPPVLSLAAAFADGIFTELKGKKGQEELNTITGWEVQNSSIPLEGYAGPTVGSLAGAQTYPDSSMTWLSDNGLTARADGTEPQDIYDRMNPDEDTGDYAIIFGRLGKVVGGHFQVFPVQPASLEIAKGRNVPSTFTVNFSLNAPISGKFTA